MSQLRTRWAAIGAAVAITLGAGGIGITHATLGTGERTAFVPINPCRLADTRPAPFNRGPRVGPLGAAATFTITATGAKVGDCTITNQATGLVLNVTALNQTQLTFLTIYPTGATRPETSNLNPSPGQPPTPNAVTVDLNASGQFDIYNLAGTVDVIVDVVGYYEDHHHDDRYFSKDDVIGIARGAQWGEIPSGMTITGSYRFEDRASAANPFIRTIQLPGLVPAPGLSYLDVNFAADASSNTIDDDASCTGSFGEPTAPPGKLCLYFGAGDGAFFLQGSVDEGEANRGTFQVWWESLASGNMSFLITYAYTAP